MRTLAPCFAFAIATVACDGPADPVTPDVAAVMVTSAVDSLGLGESATASATAFDSRDRVIDWPITWSSTDGQVVTVDAVGLLTAIRPGIAFIRARAGAAADSFRVTVVTSHCERTAVIMSSANGFWGTLVLPGHNQNAETSSGTTEYHGTPMFYGSGLVYATSPDTVIIGYDYYGHFEDFTNKSGLCGGSNTPMHTVSVLRLDTQRPNRAPSDVSGLFIVQDQFAFAEPGDNDYVLVRYTFINHGERPILNLRTGVVADFDLYEPGRNVGNYDPAAQVAYVMSDDSVSRTLVGGVAFVDTDVYSYRATRAGAPAPTRAEYHEILASGLAAAEHTPVQDVRQILAARPVTLNPGESATLWYALVVGADRGAFAVHLAAARQRARLLDQTFGQKQNDVGGIPCP